MPLFISSFKKMSFSNIIKTSVFWLILFSFMFDVCFFRSEFFYALIPDSSVGQIEVVSNRLDTMLIKSKVKILILGDSHSRDGLNPETLAETLGISTDCIFNLSISSGDPIDAYNLYLRHRKALKDVEVVLVGISEGQFIEDSSTNPTQKYRRYAAFMDRIRNNNADLLIGKFCGAYDHREIWKNIIDLKLSGEWPPSQTAEYQWGLRPRIQEMQMEDRYTSGKKRLNQWYGEDKIKIFDISEKYFTKLIKQLKDDNKSIIVVNTPKSVIYHNLRNDMQLSEEFEVYKQFIYDICSRENLELCFYDEPWDNQYFRDMNHVNATGAKRLTEEIGLFYLSQKE